METLVIILFIIAILLIAIINMLLTSYKKLYDVTKQQVKDSKDIKDSYFIACNVNKEFKTTIENLQDQLNYLLDRDSKNEIVYQKYNFPIIKSKSQTIVSRKDLSMDREKVFKYAQISAVKSILNTFEKEGSFDTIVIPVLNNNYVDRTYVNLETECFFIPISSDVARRMNTLELTHYGKV